MIAYVISMSRYDVASDNVLRCGQAVIYPCISSCRKIKYKQMIWKSYRHTGSEEDYTIYKEALNQATAEIRNSKRSYEQKIAFNITHDSKSCCALCSKQTVTSG